VGRGFRAMLRRTVPIVRFEPLGVEIDVAPGARILDVADEHPQVGIPYACRGANCGICRVRAEQGASLLQAPGPRELRLLERLDSGSDVRLGCQIRITDEPGSESRLILRVLAGR
jgi:adenylate cyclase